MRQEVFRSVVESGAGWNYCIKHFFKSGQSCDWSLSVQGVNWSRIVTLCGKGIWVGEMLEAQDCSALGNRTSWAVGSALSHPELWVPESTSDLCPEKHFRGSAGGLQNTRGWKQSNNSIYFFFFCPINWNCWSLHGVIKMFYTVCFTAWLYFPLCCWYLLKSIPKCWLPLNFEAEKLQIHIVIWFWGCLGS